MLTLEEVKEKDIRILIGLPMYGGMLSEATFHGIMQFYAWAGENKVKDLTVGSVRLIFDTASGITNFKELPDSIIKIVSKYYNEVSTTENRGVRVSGGA